MDAQQNEAFNVCCTPTKEEVGVDKMLELVLTNWGLATDFGCGREEKRDKAAV